MTTPNKTAITLETYKSTTMQHISTYLKPYYNALNLSEPIEPIEPDPDEMDAKRTAIEQVRLAFAFKGITLNESDDEIKERFLKK